MEWIERQFLGRVLFRTYVNGWNRRVVQVGPVVVVVGKRFTRWTALRVGLTRNW